MSDPVIDKTMATRIATQLGWEPKREWQSLTDEEVQVTVDEIAIDAGDSMMYPMGSFARAIEAKLKEKNT